MGQRSTKDRGYGVEHRRERAKWAPKVATGQVGCARCGQLIAPDAAWDLGHSLDRSIWTGPEHPKCNRAEGGRRGGKIRHGLAPLFRANTRQW